MVARAPFLEGGDATVGLMVPAVGIIDIHAVATRLAEAARAAGVMIATGCEATRVITRRQRVKGVELADKHALAAEIVVIAAGAWSAALGASCGAEFPLRPLRRHLVSLGVVPDALVPIPVVWRLDDEVYLRPERGGVLASPCDEQDWPPGPPPTEPAALETLGAKLTRLAPPLTAASVRRAWACLRTFAPDRLPVVGPDPRVRGLFWSVGLGGAGMTIGVAVGEILAALIAGRKHPLASTLAPARLIDGAAPDRALNPLPSRATAS